MNAIKTAVMAILWLVCAGNAMAQAKLDAQGVEAWADEVLGKAFADRRFSGAVVSIVQDGELLLAKGYGYADYAKEAPIIPSETLFRIGSISKTFTGTAIVQLLERGLIKSLDEPANNYLQRFQLPMNADRQITIWDLLTHRAGFEDRFTGLAVMKDQPLKVSGEYIESVMPALVRATGEWVVYDNFGVAVLGIMIEDLTGLLYQEYIQRNIFSPLAMSNSGVSVNTQPASQLGRPYATFPNGTFEPMPFLGMHPMFAATGAIQSTATDMARYMNAHLDAGRSDSDTILTSGSFELMHSIHARMHPLLGGWGVIFPIRQWGAEKLLAHEGAWPGSNSKMTLMMNSGAGIFISIMGGKGSNPVDDTPNPDFERMPPVDVDVVTNDFLTRFVGQYRPEESVFAEAAPTEDLSRYVGSYMTNRRSFSTYEVIDAMFQTVSVAEDGNGGLTMLGLDGFKAIAPKVFWREGKEPALVAFIEDGEGMHLVVDGVSRHYTRQQGVLNLSFLLAILPICIIVMFTGFLAAFWPARGFSAGGSRYLPVLAPLCLITMVAFLQFGFESGDSLDYVIATGRIERFVGLISVANLMAILAVLMLCACVLAWRSHYWGTGKRSVFRRIHFTLLTTALIALVPLLDFANLLGWKLP
ncbi:serine hydrolase [Pseudomaricurvus alkylphenolicus]|uniref:serine hydrolase domain-containing protein n=1 Tax=Pseudomaricurvus alkylphenolicus TaxID=1306991 RepID=UPI001420169C|nr:serine hydrolase [Pseudomaricurvus alkylphenolicus]NIB38449.1 serine hydrolase [Pseudomaricurvus alkylphenolicus]